MDVPRRRGVALVQLVDYVEATFRPLTAEKGLGFRVHVAPEVPDTACTPTSSGCCRCCATCCRTR